VFLRRTHLSEDLALERGHIEKLANKSIYCESKFSSWNSIGMLVEGSISMEWWTKVAADQGVGIQ
jgi:hypothetical protein